MALGVCFDEANTPLEKGVPAARPLSVKEVGIVTAPAPPPNPIGSEPSKKRLLDWVLVSTYVPPLKRVHLSTDIVAPYVKDVLKIIRRWIPLNQEESSVLHMRDLYSNYFRIPVAARSEQYTILLPAYMDKEDFQPMANDGMLEEI